MSVLTQTPPPASTFDIEKVRRDFPILHREVRGKRLVYLDNAATTQKPQAVIDRIVRYYTEENSNVHRGVHYLSEVSTEAYESARKIVKDFLNARDVKEIVFTRARPRASTSSRSRGDAGTSVPATK